MSYKVTNISGGQLVCDLAVKGKTLRLNNKKSVTIKDNEITPHIQNMMNKKLVLIEKVEVKSTRKKDTVKKNSKEKEE